MAAPYYPVLVLLFKPRACCGSIKIGAGCVLVNWKSWGSRQWERKQMLLKRERQEMLLVLGI